jgi:hypothetical protein
MAEETTTPAADAATTTEEKSAADAVDAGTVTVTKAEFDRITRSLADANKEAKDRRLKLDQLEADQKKADEERLQKQGEFQALAESRGTELETVKTQLKATSDEVASLRELANQQVDEAIASWPDEMKALVPNAESTDPLTRLQAMQKAKPAVELIQKNSGVVRPTPPNLDATAGGRSNGLPPEEARSEMRRMYR